MNVKEKNAQTKYYFYMKIIRNLNHSSKMEKLQMQHRIQNNIVMF